ncbi:TPA: hydroxymethylglutaryl-CoA reductase, degradative [Streptococcus agalactiae]|uniref:hydroxymethylglutaryl-CoA reductase, degradative n=1 Tax=Streptococcus agalactiae TaxID=1311 RepID=UPI0002BC689D|nr:hydroxymethylglutaryl-CoA reductase, degradative [Streptococcus agalactiae]EPV08020.1 3-hydroxy-3-methylglutaryl-CoA reductase [Streptococcus agalactiae GB00548]EPV57606.1 3-hydroxy-3-methylglutaryl-CoA reductase [Streptococcus agalactiae GB00922]HEN2764143.1 hydroxymethylglutaryl-CoA reductase, degradative [Streptococcus agalactiae]HEN8975464.1 hydroxymethylglutaryl-CoA reductase, degradative [Streptococcus agalactiae]HEN9437060.1 hydroxymethylglutaryl-CoA reductase, degradative [Streptoco
MTKISWTGFSKKSPEERIHYLEEQDFLADSSLEIVTNQDLLSLSLANQMAENVIGRIALPFSLVPDVLVNGKVYQVPYVTEEPSVVAAASFAAKIIKRSGGFLTTVHNRKMIGQVALYDVQDSQHAKESILNQKQQLLEIANAAHPSIVKRGGGACDLTIEIKEGFLIVYLMVDTKEAMGANMVNTMMEALSSPLEDISKGKSLMSILSNYATESLVTATCRVDLRFLSRQKEEAIKLAQKMTMASQLAQADPYRASTHNKGIFNGIDAIVLATGNDWRAIEAGAHTYAVKDGQYRGLSKWSYKVDDNFLEGTLTLPMPVATKGGSIGINPSVQLAHDLLGRPNAKELASIVLSIGLAQNFAALKALVSTGIQAGHMKLQAKSLALLAGAKEEQISEVVKQLLDSKHMNLETAQKIVNKLTKSKKRI